MLKSVADRINTFLLVLLVLLALSIIAILASRAGAGPLDPPGPPASTMKTLEEIPGTWSRLLSASGADPCDTPRFTCVLFGNDAVRDNETGLVWERTPDTTSLSWAAALQTCSDSLLGGRGGWRVPTETELRSLLDPGGSSQPILPDGNPFVFAGPFGLVWTMSPVPGETDLVYSVDADTLDRDTTPKTTPLHRWCVRGAQADAPEDSALAEVPTAWYRLLNSAGGCFSERFRCVMNNEAVLDRETGLVWQRTPPANPTGWLDSFNVCSEAETGGRRGWRTPTREEISTLYLDANPFPGLPAGNPFVHGISPGSNHVFWTRTEWGGGADAWVFLTGLGGYVQSNTTGPYRVWCVRAPGASVEDF